MKNKQKQKQAQWIANTQQKKAGSAKSADLDIYADDQQEQFNRALDADLNAPFGDEDGSEDDDYVSEDEDLMPLDMEDEDSDDEDSDEDEEEEQEINDIVGIRSKLPKKFDEISDKAWGVSKNKFYDRDVNIDNDDKISSRKRKTLREKEENYAQEEEQEAIRLQKEKAKALRREDFIGDDDEDDGTIGSLIKKKSSVTDFNDVNYEDDEEQDETDNGENFDDIEDSEERLRLKRERLEKMSNDEKIEMVKRDSPELLTLLSEFKTNVKIVREKIAPILDLANQRKEIQNLKGISFLELKYHLLLNYCTNISFYLLLKAEGKSIKDHPVVEELVRNRTVLEKMKPLDAKLKYQIDKLLKVASSGPASQADLSELAEFETPDALSHRPSLDNFSFDDGQKEIDEDAAYVPPKLATIHFEETGYKKKDRNEQRAVKSSIAKFLKSTFSNEPEVLDASGAGIEYSNKKREDKEEREHEELEEENFFRAARPKKSIRKVRKESDLVREFAHLEDFSDLAALDKKKDDDEEMENYRKEKALKKALENLGNEKKPKKQIHGDEDIPYPVQQKLYQNKRKYEAEDDESSNKSRKINLSDEDEMYQEQSKKIQQKKKNKKKDTGPKIIPKAERTVKEGAKRKITQDINKNKGLTPYRKKETRNSRVKLRGKFEKAQRRLTGAGQKQGTSGVALTPYSGETRGIKSHVAHSISMRDS